MEEAQEAVAQLEAAWKQYGVEQASGPAVAAKQAIERQLANQLDELRKRRTAYEANLRRLEKTLGRRQRSWQRWQAWSSPFAAGAIGCIGISSSILLGTTAAILVGAGLGILLAFISLCLASLGMAGWFLTSGNLAANRIAALAAVVEQLQQQRSEAMASVATAVAAYNVGLHRWEQANARYRQVAYAYNLQRKLEGARHSLNGLLAIIQSERYQLLHTPWRAMRGTEFEAFLKRVFELLGYSVQLTKASGDQGVDLILVRGERRIAVQAKGYEKNVGNDAVQAVHAGMKCYSCPRTGRPCDSCVVVTNSGFTKSAKALAYTVGCRLIEGNDLPALIRGEVTL